MFKICLCDESKQTFTHLPIYLSIYRSAGGSPLERGQLLLLHQVHPQGGLLQALHQGGVRGAEGPVEDHRHGAPSEGDVDVSWKLQKSARDFDARKIRELKVASHLSL